jgi:pimeloyl-ACP methyl ester carboxylesterase
MNTQDHHNPNDHPVSIPRPGLPTLGGLQFWADLVYRQGYRIQQNVFTGHHRLLNPANRRVASGTLADCRRSLDALRQSTGLQPDTGHAVIYLHGIGRTSRCFRPILKAMPRDGFTHIPFEYPSTRVPLETCAEYLHSLISSLTDVSRISFVVHSMGGLVVRRYLQDHQDPRLFRVVMMGTPNQGAELAARLKRWTLFRAIFGPAGQELAADPAGIVAALPIPQFEFGIIAGGRGDDRGFNPLLPGDNDGTVTVASTRLDGSRDFLRVPRMHSFLMQDLTVIAAVQNFLNHGRFGAEDQLG